MNFIGRPFLSLEDFNLKCQQFSKLFDNSFDHIGFTVHKAKTPTQQEQKQAAEHENDTTLFPCTHPAAFREEIPRAALTKEPEADYTFSSWISTHIDWDSKTKKHVVLEKEISFFEQQLLSFEKQPPSPATTKNTSHLQFSTNKTQESVKVYPCVISNKSWISISNRRDYKTLEKVISFFEQHACYLTGQIDVLEQIQELTRQKETPKYKTLKKRCSELIDLANSEKAEEALDDHFKKLIPPKTRLKYARFFDLEQLKLEIQALKEGIEGAEGNRKTRRKAYEEQIKLIQTNSEKYWSEIAVVQAAEWDQKLKEATALEVDLQAHFHHFLNPDTTAHMKEAEDLLLAYEIAIYCDAPIKTTILDKIEKLMPPDKALSYLSKNRSCDPALKERLILCLGHDLRTVRLYGMDQPDRALVIDSTAKDIHPLTVSQSEYKAISKHFGNLGKEGFQFISFSVDPTKRYFPKLQQSHLFSANVYNREVLEKTIDFFDANKEAILGIATPVCSKAHKPFKRLKRAANAINNKPLASKCQKLIEYVYKADQSSVERSFQEAQVVTLAKATAIELEIAKALLEKEQLEGKLIEIAEEAICESLELDSRVREEQEAAELRINKEDYQGKIAVLNKKLATLQSLNAQIAKTY